jgi:hypothetical protein
MLHQSRTLRLAIKQAFKGYEASVVNTKLSHNLVEVNFIRASGTGVGATIGNLKCSLPSGIATFAN